MSALNFKKNDLYVYDLTQDVLDSLKLMHFDANLNEVEVSKKEEEVDNTPVKNVEAIRSKGISNSLFCNTCKLEFPDQLSKREHYRADYHTFNLKRSLRGLSVVSKIEYEQFLKNSLESKTETSEEEKENTSETEDSSDGTNEDETSSTEDKLESIFETKLDVSSMSDDTDDDKDTSITHLNTRSPKIYFKSKLISENEVVGIYKSLFDQDSIDNPTMALKKWSNPDTEASSISAMFMIGGGHFAGAIVSHQRLSTKGNAKKQDVNLKEQAVLMLEHKTFHRYTTRRKQGGSQSASDNAKGKANSAGSSIRRYNEAALKIDVQNLLKEWEPYLAKCDNIFLRATSVHDKKIFTDSSYIKKNDERLRSFPFTTGRPTIGELKKSWCELTYIKVEPKPVPIVVKKKTIGNTKETQIKKSNKSNSATSLTLEEKHSEELVNLVKKGRAPLLISYLRKNDINVNYPIMPETKYSNTPTMLHFASQQGQKQMIGILLTNLKADPTIKNKFGKTAWDLAKNDSVKHAFQIARHTLGETYINWDETNIGMPLSREEVEKINLEEEEREKAEVEQAIRKELEVVKERQQMDKEIQQAKKDMKRGEGKILDASSISNAQNLNSLSEDQRKRLMREQRARAAEARMKAMQGK
ncbi:hypothetical protein Kpol_1052p10 [Vanderwaltozyma polyspora DSM 70294]|uniref:VLRF1 domain-containing protein n=1 Tax=Vanderwaltozyma polyspora (strain ATCC 22028 / DSM 70294 / BCRC 21397 / CBS 2163 / NBRC 10782 / NRRL Y-8283 / UCD 57-17) TaxID=436907 RepID=A7TM21_VANPO|nr:uncharacterized protein Kpol_1052p10 [Vanderwaltozyma polyspora DSM 70294]EDO16663.1 hypothetical protein Kpol_1052p10 [Vanderwaltozyma polyspora DSM 70294]